MRASVLIAAAILAAPLGACADHIARRETISPHAGDAKAANAAVHMIDPWPPESRDARIGMDGVKAQQAIERYRRPSAPPATAAPSAAGITITPAQPTIPRQD